MIRGRIVSRYKRASCRKKYRVAPSRRSRQTGKRKSLSMDRARKAKPPGKRISKSGKTYYERRRNRSDRRGKRI